MRHLGRSREYDAISLPERLRRWHAPRANRWERLAVVAGSIGVEWLRADGIRPETVSAGETRWIAPGRRWRLAELGTGASFVLEVHADEASSPAAPQALRANLLDAATRARVRTPAELERFLAALAGPAHCLLQTNFDPFPALAQGRSASQGRLAWHPLAADAGGWTLLLVQTAAATGLAEYLGRDHAVIEGALAGALAGDRLHHAWLQHALARHLWIEEELLFPAWVEAGGPPGWVRGLRNEHTHLRRDLGHLDEAVARRRFLLLLDGHDEKEEQTVYPDILARLEERRAELTDTVIRCRGAGSSAG